MKQKIKPSLSKGTRDFLPREVAKRNYISDTIKTVFRNYGYEQIETPAIERLETLAGKYGDEGDKLLFKILNSGDYLKEVPDEILTSRNSAQVTKYIAEKGLRYDLTVPLARYVVQHQGKIAFPFKRFHIGPVWRADRPQKGRYQEFYQCDADVIGSRWLWSEVELTHIFLDVFAALKIPVKVQINHRRILYLIAKHYGYENHFKEFSTIIDKLDKIGYEGVVNELKRSGISAVNVKESTDGNDLSHFREGLMSSHKSWKDLTLRLKDIFKDWQEEHKHIDELYHVTRNFEGNPLLVFNPYLARGLDYYTGIIWEVVIDKSDERCVNLSLGSIASGGRYDNLTEVFGGQNMSGVGISFGIERIYDVMEELKLFPETIVQGVKVLFVPREPAVEEFTFKQVQTLRNAGVSAEMFFNYVKKQKHYEYATAKGISFIVEVGQDEKATGIFRVKDVSTQQEQRRSTQELIELLKECNN
ncbi:MAG: histidine--tRNA ligase [Chitinophagales bacterium]|nr:histidine--tRNA ligase [Chitinophagales bacterium]MDW8418825.1 histidine--tRNA ligase [Chitinophagales bacterium]